MLTAVKNNIRYFALCVYHNIKSALQYRLNFWIQVIFMMINNFAFLISWFVILYANGGDINGIVIQDILYLWGVPNIAFGVGYFFFGGVSTISQALITGGMDPYLIQPKHPLITLITSKSVISAMGDLLYGILMLCFATNFQFTKIVLGIILGIFASGIFLSTEIIIRSLAVWLGDMDVVAERYTNTFLITFCIYPEQIFPTVIKILIYTVIPSAYISSIPNYAIQTENMWYFLWFIGMLILFCVVAVFTFNKAIKRYESGNNITMRD